MNATVPPLPAVIMRSGLLLVAFALVFGVTTARTDGVPPPPAEHDRLERQVCAAEGAFAATMADRDIDAFAEFIADDAIFLDKSGSLRGRDAVVSGWSRYFAGPTAPFSWQPDRVEVLESGELALSTGPVFDSQDKQIGTFTSIWRREPSGDWRIVFDRGCPVCETP